jgi:FixJ family two-component response regulator
VTAVAPIIHVIDDDAAYRAAVARLLRKSGYEVALYESAVQLLQNPPNPGLGCILLDVMMPDLSGPQLQDRLSELGSALPIVFLSGHGDIPTSVRAIKAGAEDFLSKPVPKETLIEAIERALARCQGAQERHDRLIALRALVAKLTPREREVFAQVARGKLSKEIAFEFGIAVRTIKAHRRSVIQKLKVKSLLELVSIAEQLGILAASEHREPSSSGPKRPAGP